MTAAAVSPVRTVPSRDAVMAQSAHENFPVALAVLGRRVRTHLLAIYGFARLVDDIGDEATGDRTAHLDWLTKELELIYAGAEERLEHPVMRTLAATVRECALPSDPFRRLLQANRQDQVQTRYATFEELIGYCQLSAAPVGELVLHVFGAATPERIALSDRVCAALQVIEHLQDVREDHARGRIYIPTEDLERFGCTESDLSGERAAKPLRTVVSYEAGRAGELLASGPALVRMLRGRARLAVSGFVAGGRAALDGLRRAQYDVLSATPRPVRQTFIKEFPKAVIGR